MILIVGCCFRNIDLFCINSDGPGWDRIFLLLYLAGTINFFLQAELGLKFLLLYRVGSIQFLYGPGSSKKACTYWAWPKKSFVPVWLDPGLEILARADLFPEYAFYTINKYVEVWIFFLLHFVVTWRHGRASRVSLTFRTCFVRITWIEIWKNETASHSRCFKNGYDRR